MNEGMFDDTVKRIEAREAELLASMRAMLGISPKVTLVAPQSIARSEGKAVRVIDKRKI
jgi:phenylacetate-CoA ligase